MNETVEHHTEEVTALEGIDDSSCENNEDVEDGEEDQSYDEEEDGDEEVIEEDCEEIGELQLQQDQATGATTSISGANGRRITGETAMIEESLNESQAY